MAIGVVAIAAGGCGEDETPGPTGDGSALKDTGGGGGDILPWPDAFLRKDSAPWSCSASSATACGSKKSMYCSGGVCKDCPAYYYNCDLVGTCECLGACDGAKCVGTSSKCAYDDKNVCGGSQTQYCVNAVCTPCPTGTSNCDKTKDCECTNGCNNNKCK